MLVIFGLPAHPARHSPAGFQQAFFLVEPNGTGGHVKFSRKVADAVAGTHKISLFRDFKEYNLRLR